MPSAVGPRGQTFAESSIRNARRCLAARTPRVGDFCCALETGKTPSPGNHIVLLPTAPTATAVRGSRRAGHSDADRSRPRARGLSGEAHTHARIHVHTHTQKERKKELGASCSGLCRRLHPNDSAPRAGHGPPSRDARTHATGDQTGGELRGCRDRWLWPECKGPRAARSLSQTRPSGLGQQRHAACVAQPRRWPSPAVLSPAWPPAPGGGKLKFPSSGFVVHPRAKPSRAPR